MMLLHRIEKRGVRYVMVFIAFVFCMAQYSNADDDIEQIKKDIQETLRSLGIPRSEETKNNEQHLAWAIQAFNEALASDDEETKEILKQWDEYITSVSHYSNTDYSNTIMETSI